MGLKETVLGWLRSTPEKSEDLKDAAIDETTREYNADKSDSKAGFRLGTEGDDFDADQDAPRR